MLAVVKKPHIEMRGELTEAFLECIRAHFGKNAVNVVDDDEELLTLETSEWFADTPVSPADSMRIYREIHEMTQQALGDRLGGVARQEISKMETGKRAISKNTAKALAGIFDVSVDRFIPLSAGPGWDFCPQARW